MIAELPSGPLLPAFQEPRALVCVIDDEESIRCSLHRLFRSAHIRVETFASAADYMARPPNDGPVCLIVDVNMPVTDGFGLQRALAGGCERIVFLTGHGDIPMCAQAMKAGAVDFLTKPVDDEVLLGAVHRAFEQARETTMTCAHQAISRKALDSLTCREFEVMQCVIAGMLNKQIAAQLGIAEKTVKIHRGRVMHKTGTCSVPELIGLVQSAGAYTRDTQETAP